RRPCSAPGCLRSPMPGGARPHNGEPAVSTRWKAGTFLAKAQELSRRLTYWHIDDFRSPVMFVTEEQSWGEVRRTFREILANMSANPSPRPQSLQLFTYKEGKPDGQGVWASPIETRTRSRTARSLNG